MSALTTVAKGKGAANVFRRAREIRAHYGIGPERMEQRIETILDVVEPFGCRATLPITAAVVARHPRAISSYAALGVEFPVHGYVHVDHAALSDHAQLAQLARARQVFEREGLPIIGFRAPYLRWNDATLCAVRETGFLYDGSQAMGFRLADDSRNEAYRRVLDFCGALPAEEYPVVPWTESGVIRIPYVLPDDEAIVDRLRVTSPEAVAERWLQVFTKAHRCGELFTLAVHPERIETCRLGITAVLEATSRAELPVWTTRHEEIARWWRDRGAATVVLDQGTTDRLGVTIKGPVGVTVLARGLDVPDSKPWADGYQIVQRTHFDVAAAPRPFIGVHPSAPEALTEFLREQGYIVETSTEARRYTCFLVRHRFGRRDQRPLLEEIERGTGPLLRFGRWPHGARSALSITGDIDALTLGDYAYRILGALSMSTDECVAPVIVCADVDRAEWRAFVDAEPTGNVFHTPEMAAAFARTPGHKVSPWAACSQSGAILALIVPVHVTLAAGPLRRWTSRAVAYGGVARAEGASGTAAAVRLLHEYGRSAQPDLLFTELRHQDDASDIQPALRAAGFVHEPHLNYLVALDRSEADLWSGLSRSAKQRVRSAEKKGIKVVDAEDDATVDAAYWLLADVYRRARVPLASPTMFAAARAELHARGMLRIVTAQLDERVVAARFLLLYKSRIVDWYAGSDRSFASYSPTEYLVWEVLRWGCEHGYEVFDFGGAGRPDEPYGPREFKSKFGGELVGFGRDVFVHAPHRLRVSRAAYSAARRLRRGAGA